MWNKEAPAAEAVGALYSLPDSLPRWAYTHPLDVSPQHRSRDSWWTKDPAYKRANLGGGRVMWNEEAPSAGAGGALYSLPGTFRPGRHTLNPQGGSSQCRSRNCSWAKDLTDNRAGLGEAGLYGTKKPLQQELEGPCVPFPDHLPQVGTHSPPLDGSPQHRNRNSWWSKNPTDKRA